MGQQLADQSKFFPTNYFHIAIHFYTWFSLKVPLDSLYLVIHFCKLSDKSCSQINPNNSKSRYLHLSVLNKEKITEQIEVVF